MKKRKKKLNDCCVRENLEEWDCFCTYGPPGCQSCDLGWRCKTCGALIERRRFRK